MEAAVARRYGNHRQPEMGNDRRVTATRGCHGDRARGHASSDSTRRLGLARVYGNSQLGILTTIPF